MRRVYSLLTAAALAVTLAGCGSLPAGGQTGEEKTLILADSGVSLNGQPVTENTEAVTVSHDIVYYEAGHGADYGEGEADEAHSAEEAAAHTVVTVRKPGTYRVSGSLSPGQLAVDLGEGAQNDAGAVVTLILDGASITCTVAPALIFYRVYECDRQWMETGEGYLSSPVTDTSAAGANLVLADGSENRMEGSHVARIYRTGTTEKLHKYDGAVYSKMSMNLSADGEGTGALRITADHEGLDSELHLTINGGVIDIAAQNDGINTNEDHVSVTTVNGGTLTIDAGLGGEGDGIDSNGHLVINGGVIRAFASAESMDGGLDADDEIRLNGGWVLATGNMQDPISEHSEQAYVSRALPRTVVPGEMVSFCDGTGEEVLAFTAEKSFQCLLFTMEGLDTSGELALRVNGELQQQDPAGNGPGGMAGAPEGMEPPEGFADWLDSAEGIPEEIRTWLERFAAGQGNGPENPQGRPGQPPEGMPSDRPEGS